MTISFKLQKLNNMEQQSTASTGPVPEESKNELSMRLNIIERDKLVPSASFMVFDVTHFRRFTLDTLQVTPGWC